MSVDMELLLAWCIEHIECDVCQQEPATLRFMRDGRVLFVCPDDEALLMEVAPIDQPPVLPPRGDTSPTV